MPLESELFKSDPRLQACLIQDAAHVALGARGEYVRRIQSALVQLDGAQINDNELQSGSYGASTASAVLAYKEEREIINYAYQAEVDNIVGKMTIAAMDKELLGLGGGRLILPFVIDLNMTSGWELEDIDTFALSADFFRLQQVGMTIRQTASGRRFELRIEMIGGQLGFDSILKVLDKLPTMASKLRSISDFIRKFLPSSLSRLGRDLPDNILGRIISTNANRLVTKFLIGPFSPLSIKKGVIFKDPLLGAGDLALEDLTKGSIAFLSGEAGAIVEGFQGTVILFGAGLVPGPLLAVMDFILASQLDQNFTVMPRAVGFFGAIKATSSVGAFSEMFGRVIQTKQLD